MPGGQTYHGIHKMKLEGHSISMVVTLVLQKQVQVLDIVQYCNEELCSL